jgi:tetratricopeptide (TPR) repeat protein
MTATSRRDALDPDALAALEDQRDFLLQSLDDLEAERAAGDIDEHDYETLRDDYTARAATVLRAIEERNTLRAAARAPKRRGQAVLVGTLVAIIAILCGVLVAQNAGRRAPGEGITGSDDSSSRSVLAEADDLLASGETDAALTRYQDALELDPQNLEILHHLATAQVTAGDADAAIKTYDDALAIDPEDVESLAYQASLFHRRGDTDRALEQLDHAIALDRTFVDSWSLRTAILGDAGRLDEALADITQLAKDGDNDIALAVAQQVAGVLPPVDALKVYDAILDGDPDDAEALSYRGWQGASLVVGGQMEGSDAETVLNSSLEFLDQAVAADPTRPDAHVFRAIVLHRLGRDDEAADELRAFDATDPPAQMQQLVDQFGLRDALGVDPPD